jgi:hypothetical protein
MTISMKQIENLTNNHFQMENYKMFEVGHVLNFISKVFWLIQTKT